jgi:hypothetical protein
VEGVLALANYGPTATLFTLGPNFTVQQYDLSPPALTKNVRHDPNASTPTQQIQSAQVTPKINQHGIPGAAPPIPMYHHQQQAHSNASLSSLQRAQNEMQAMEHARQLRQGMASPASTASRTESIDSRSSAGGRSGYRKYAPSVSSRAASGTTFSTFSPSVAARDSYSNAPSTYFGHTASIASSSRRSKGSRLRQEVIMSPEVQVLDLFPYTRARLANLPYQAQSVQPLDPSKASSEELRLQMLKIVFGWEGDIEPMIRDELSHHPQGSMNSTLLSKWLGETQIDSMASLLSENPLSTTDWMLLAISQMNGQGSGSKQLGHSFVQRLLQQGDIHTAATILLGMGDREDAIEIYVSRNYYMEGILLACLLFPEEWQRQAHLVRRWGEFVVENSQQHLAIRCFSCTGVDTSVAWASPTQSPFAGSQPQQGLPQIISPPTSPPGNKPMASRVTTKNASLKLITSFGQETAKFNFLASIRADDRTPTNAPGVTPIAESALSPGGTPSTYLRPQLRSRNAVPKTPAGQYARHRLPSIGESPIDVNQQFSSSKREGLPTPNDSGSEMERPDRSSIKHQEATILPSTVEEAPLTLSSARYDPSAGDQTPSMDPQTAVPGTAVRTLPPASKLFPELKEKARPRMSSRDRKPDGLHIQMPSLDRMRFHNYTGTDDNQSVQSGRSDAWGSMASGASLSSANSLTANSLARNNIISPPATGASWTSSVKSPSVSGRSMDQYISSLEEAQFYSTKPKESRRTARSRDGRASAAGEHKSSRTKTKHREPSEDRGRAGQKYIRPAKRSPSSPVPMSPEDLQKYRDVNNMSIESALSLSRDSSPEINSSHSRGQSTRRKTRSKSRALSKASEFSHRTATTMRRRSPSAGDYDGQFGSEYSSRRLSPERGYAYAQPGRGRSQSHQGSKIRSPSSPLPMSPGGKNSEDEESAALRLVEANRQRLRSSHRSTSRRPGERASSVARRDRSPDRRKTPDERPLYRSSNLDQSATDQRTSDGEKFSSDSNAPNNKLQSRSTRALKKELAARELAARRESLLVRATEAAIPHPSSLYEKRPQLTQRSISELNNNNNNAASWNQFNSPPIQNGNPNDYSNGPELNPENRSASTGPAASNGPFGLPSTPRAMRHPRYQSRDDDIPAVPELPDSYYQQNTANKRGDSFYQAVRGDSFYQAAQQLPRSMSAPIPEKEFVPPTDMPTHPAFHRGLRPSTKQRSNMAPLGDIGRQRRSPSIDAGSAPHTSIDERIRSSTGHEIIVVPENPFPPIIPELQHLAHPPPPPPPPPPPAPFRDDTQTHSISSGSGVGTINIVMDDASCSGTPTIDVSSISTSRENNTKSPPVPPPPAPQQMTSPNLSETGHRRGRSIDPFGTKFKGIADRMRSTSRGRNVTKSPKPVQEFMQGQRQLYPYESVPEYMTPKPIQEFVQQGGQHFPYESVPEFF